MQKVTITISEGDISKTWEVGLDDRKKPPNTHFFSLNNGQSAKKVPCIVNAWVNKDFKLIVSGAKNKPVPKVAPKHTGSSTAS